MSAVTYGSLCSGYEGIGLGLSELFDLDVRWQAENDEHASKILATRFPGVPNLGDLTAVDWTTVEPVDVLTAGFPCQDLSYAGRGAGITEGTRSGLWFTVAAAIGALRPRLVVLENVSAIVGRRPGLDVVLADIAAIGFDAEWLCVRASDVGACHGRDRWYCLAWHAAGGARDATPPTRPFGDRRSAQPARGSGGVAADATGDGRDEGRTEPARLVRGLDVAERGHAPTDTASTERGASQSNSLASPAGRTSEPRECAGSASWGAYEPAIRRWERILGRSAPHPTEPGPNGQRLAPRFVEWMMGLPAGWVTDVDIPRNAQLKALGNGVVPQQCAAAVSALLDRAAVAA